MPALELKVSLTTVMDQHLGITGRTPGTDMASEDIEECQRDAEFSDETSTEQGSIQTL